MNCITEQKADLIFDLKRPRRKEIHNLRYFVVIAMDFKIIKCNVGVFIKFMGSETLK